MKDMITRENYIGYKKLYAHKSELPSSILLMFLIDILIIGFCMVACIPITMTNIISFSSLMLNHLIPIISSASVITLISDYNKKIYEIKKEYPNINVKINIKDLEIMIKEYKTMEHMIQKCDQIKENILDETIHNYSSLKCNKIYEEELDKVKVKVKTSLSNRKR